MGDWRAAPPGDDSVSPHDQPYLPVMADTTLRVIPLGGLGEIGMNLMVYECGDEAILVDCGMMFPDAATLGVDVIVPDMTYIFENASKFKALFLTHGHEDHIGAVPFLVEKLRSEERRVG